MAEGSGSQVPSDEERVLPTNLVPVTTGASVATGALVIASVDAVKCVENPTELVATTRATTYLPKKELSAIVRVAVVEFRTGLQFPLVVGESVDTREAQINH